MATELLSRQPVARIAEPVEEVLKPFMKVTNQVLAWIWWNLSFAGWVVALGGLSAMQDYCDSRPIAINHSTYVWSWNEASRHPRIQCGKIFRLEWWVVWLDFVALLLTFLALFRIKTTHNAKYMLIGLLASATVLSSFAAWLVNNILDTVAIPYGGRGGKMKTATRVAFGGFIIATAAQYGLMYHLGVV